MITALIIIIVGVLYLVGAITILALELGLLVAAIFWPILLPVPIVWKIILAVIWLIVVGLFIGD